MNFASRNFFIFFPIVLLIYHLLGKREHKYRFLLVASWFFYMSWNPFFLWVILFTTVVDYYSGIMIEGAKSPRQKKFWLISSILSNLGFLAFFKYTNFFIENCNVSLDFFGVAVKLPVYNIILPLGISFHTFQGISYTLDVYQGKIKAMRSFEDFALFVAFFPQLVAGPIVRAVEFLPQMQVPPKVKDAQILDGFQLILIGLLKKTFLADQLASFVDPVFHEPARYDAATHFWAALAYACQIYCDFSGYSDLAIGCSKWFGFELPVNFRFPYLATSIADFWHRWHISLSTWMRDYCYIPLGGSRNGSLKTNFNLVVTMTLCGLWHGASWNFVIWGFFNGVLLSLHRILKNLVPPPSEEESGIAKLVSGCFFWFLTMIAVISGWIILRSESWAGCWITQRALLGGFGSFGLDHHLPFWVPVLVLVVVAEHGLGYLGEIAVRLERIPLGIRASAYVGILCLLVLFSANETKPFIYFQF